MQIGSESPGEFVQRVSLASHVKTGMQRVRHPADLSNGGSHISIYAEPAHVASGFAFTTLCPDSGELRWGSSNATAESDTGAACNTDTESSST